jgi:hypothetical protein
MNRSWENTGDKDRIAGSNNMMTLCIIIIFARINKNHAWARVDL